MILRVTSNICYENLIGILISSDRMLRSNNITGLQMLERGKNNRVKI